MISSFRSCDSGVLHLWTHNLQTKVLNSVWIQSRPLKSRIRIQVKGRAGFRVWRWSLLSSDCPKQNNEARIHIHFSPSTNTMQCPGTHLWALPFLLSTQSGLCALPPHCVDPELRALSLSCHRLSKPNVQCTVGDMRPHP